MAPTANWRQYQSSNSTTSGRSDNSTASGHSDHSAHSARSYDTAPTEYSDRRPSLLHSETCHPRVQGRGREPDYFVPQHQVDRYPQPPPRASVDTYASTSEEDLADEVDDMPDYDVPTYRHEPLACDAIPTTPRDFGELFPTSKRLSIRHDDSTIDGNMNLRVDTQVEEYLRRGFNSLTRTPETELHPLPPPHARSSHTSILPPPVLQRVRTRSLPFDAQVSEARCGDATSPATRKHSPR